MTRRRGPGEGPAFMTEHFGFEQFVRNGGTIDRDEVASGADRLGVNRMGYNFFSATAFAP